MITDRQLASVLLLALTVVCVVFAGYHIQMSKEIQELKEELVLQNTTNYSKIQHSTTKYNIVTKTVFHCENDYYMEKLEPIINLMKIQQDIADTPWTENYNCQRFASDTKSIWSGKVPRVRVVEGWVPHGLERPDTRYSMKKIGDTWYTGHDYNRLEIDYDPATQTWMPDFVFESYSMKW